ncbi:MAG TPA: DNA recombination protein RmuC, partial [Phenylobacterium sp.]|nr:DNA recombination protein RmuC [Phenylobacterium sp.]
MNGTLIAAFAFALVAAGAIVWALKERMRAAAAEMRIEMLREQADLVTAQLTQSATGVAEAILKKNEEAIHNREQLAQARLEAQLKPVAESLQKFQEHVALAEKVRVEETGGLKEQIAALLLASAAT